MDRVTWETLERRAENVNRRLEGTGRYVYVQGRNGHIALDEYELAGGTPDDLHDSAIRTIVVGTKREIADFLHAMMVGIDLSRTNSREASVCGGTGNHKYQPINDCDECNPAYSEGR